MQCLLAAALHQCSESTSDDETPSSSPPTKTWKAPAPVCRWLVLSAYSWRASPRKTNRVPPLALAHLAQASFLRAACRDVGLGPHPVYLPTPRWSDYQRILPREHGWFSLCLWCVTQPLVSLKTAGAEVIREEGLNKYKKKKTWTVWKKLCFLLYLLKCADGVILYIIIFIILLLWKLISELLQYVWSLHIALKNLLRIIFYFTRDYLFFF